MSATRATTVRAVLRGRTQPLGQTSSAIDKQPVVGPARIRALGLEGDEQADRRVHGGEDKALHCYPWQHYAAWRVGTAETVVTQGRQPCFKLNLRFGVADMAARVQNTLRAGWYLRVERAGEVAADDQLVLLDRPHPAFSVAHLLALIRDRVTESGADRAVAALAVATQLAALVRAATSCATGGGLVAPLRGAAMMGASSVEPLLRESSDEVRNRSSRPACVSSLWDGVCLGVPPMRFESPSPPIFGTLTA